MNVIILYNQSAFISNRLIIDNIMITHELLHSLNKLRKCTNEKMTVKLDMLKVYDWIEWPFIEAMMKALSFSEKPIRLVISCISSVSYSILIKGKPRKSFAPSRGLRQGDHLFSYIFLMCVESLSSLINNAERKREIQGSLIAREYKYKSLTVCRWKHLVL